MLPGDAALQRPVNWEGRVVDGFSQSRYCHIRLITSTDGTTLEANPGGAKPGHVQQGDVIITAPITDEQRAKVAAVAAQYEGTPYSWYDLFALALEHLGVRLPSLDQQIERPDRLFCSQLVDIVWQGVGYHAFTDGRLSQNVTPGDIADLAFGNGWKASTYKE